MRRLHRHVAIALIAALTLGAAAAGQKLKVESEHDKDADFTAVKTYAWLPPAPMIKNVAPDAMSNPNLTDEVLGPHITTAIDRQLTRRGLAKVDRDQADVLVVYLAALTVGYSRTYLGEYYGYVTGWGSPIAPGLAPSTSSNIHEQGTIVVDMVHRASNRAIWHGSVVTRIHQQRKLEDRIERINEAAERMFERFPIRAGK